MYMYIQMSILPIILSPLVVLFRSICTNFSVIFWSKAKSSTNEIEQLKKTQPVSLAIT